MQAHTLYPWIARRISVRTRLAQVGVSYLLFLMVVTRKHALEEGEHSVILTSHRGLLYNQQESVTASCHTRSHPWEQLR